MAGDVLREFLISVGFVADEASARKVEGVAGRVERAVIGADRRTTDAQGVGSARRVLQANREAGIRTRGAAQLIAETRRVGEADAKHTQETVARSKDRERADKDAATASHGRSTAFATATLAMAAAAAYAATRIGTALVQIAGNMEQVYYSSQRTKSSAANLRAFGYAAGQMGSSAGEANASLEALAKNMRSSPGYASMLNGLGVATEENGKIRDTVDVVQDLGSVLAKMPGFQAKAYADALGIDERTLTALKSGEFTKHVAEYRDMLDKARLNPEKAAKDSAAFMNVWRRMQTGLEIIGTRIEGALVNRFGGSVTKFTDWLLKNSDRIADGVIRIGETILRLVGRVANLFSAFDKLDPATKGFIVQLGAMGAALMLLRAGPLGVILALGTGILALYDDFRKWKEGGTDTLIDWAKWEPAIKAALESFKSLWEGFDAVAKKLTGQDGLTLAFIAFGTVLALNVLAPLGKIMTLLTGFGALRLPPWLLGLLGVAGLAGVANANGILGTGEAGQGLGERALRTLDPGLGDRVYGQSGGDRAADAKDNRNLWQRYAPKFLGGKDAPGDRGRDIRPTSKDIHPEMAAYIRSAAEKRGINPNTAIGIADGEGLGGSTPNRLTPGDYRNGVPTSFGPFQLHRGGKGSVGTEYEKATGHKVDDPAHWQEQVDFALDWAKKNGWGAWYGRSKHNIGLREGLDYAPRVGGTQTAGDTPSVNGVGGVEQRQGGIRSQPITDALRNQIAAAAKAAGVNAEIYSGGQDESGPNRTGSHRHDNGQSADLKLYTIGADGKRRYLSMNNDGDRSVMEAFIRGSVKAGANGVGSGPGYMGESGIHIGGGSPSAWGAGGQSANAPDWVRRAHQNGMEDRSRAASPAPAIGKAIEAIPKIEGALQRFDDRLGQATGGAQKMVAPEAAPLGAQSVTNANRTSTITAPQSNTFHINGASDPKAVSSEVGRTQTRVHADLLRNLQGAVA